MMVSWSAGLLKNFPRVGVELCDSLSLRSDVICVFGLTSMDLSGDNLPCETTEVSWLWVKRDKVQVQQWLMLAEWIKHRTFMQQAGVSILCDALLTFSVAGWISSGKDHSFCSIIDQHWHLVSKGDDHRKLKRHFCLKLGCCRFQIPSPNVYWTVKTHIPMYFI